MKRRSTDSASSLDLFLDTICNAFGGIMFIAILLSIISQFRSKSNEATSPSDPTAAQQSVDDFEKMVSEARDLRESLDELRQQAASLGAETSQAEKEAFQEAMEKLAALNAEYDAITKNLEDTLQNNVQMELDLKKLDEDLAQKQKELAQKSGELAEARSKKMISMELPIVRSSRKSNLIVVMRYGKTYLAKGSDLGGYNTAHVKVRSLLGTDYVSPIPAAGWSLDNVSDLASFASQMNQYSGITHIVSIGVWPDSYDAFAAAKAQLIKMGFEYELIPLGDVAEVAVSSRTDAPRVQ